MWVRLPSRRHPLTDILEITVPSSSGQDACLTSRIAQVRVLPGRSSISPTHFGLLVQRDDTCLASRKSGFDSPAVHSVSLEGRQPDTVRRAAVLTRAPHQGIRVRLPGLPLQRSKRLDGETEIISRFEREVPGSNPGRGMGLSERLPSILRGRATRLATGPDWRSGER